MLYDALVRGLDIPGAGKYNLSQAGKTWTQEDLPWPFSFKNLLPGAEGFLMAPDSTGFIFAVAAFQSANGLLPDGKLGPATFAAMRAMGDLAPESEAAHDFEEDMLDEDEHEPETEDAPREAERPRNPIAVPPSKPTFEPARKNVSNCLMIGGRKIKLSDELLALGITASNYIDDDEYWFKDFRPRKSVTHFVIHESVTMSAAQTNRVLINKRARSAKRGKNRGKGWDYGIHLNLAPDGHISCHADLIGHRLVQANQLNNDSFGIEIVNPYNPKFGRGPFTKTMEGPWWCWKPKNAERIYTLPTPAQLRCLAPLCKFLAEHIEGLPLEFPTRGLGPRQTRIDGWRDGAKPGPGIVAHRDFASHADGRYPLEHIIEQLEG